jgi:pimeloyl-ACP methyl ester carboxylesterase
MAGTPARLGFMNAIEEPQGNIIEVGGHHMYVIDVGVGDTVIFLHGGGPGADAWVDMGMMLPFFSDRRCVLPDLLRYGKSDLVRHTEPTWSFQARHIDLLMEALGIESADFVCSSVGGSVALALAAEYPHRVQRIVASGATPTTEMPGRPGGGAGPGAEWVARYYGGEGPTWQKSRDLIAELEYFDGSLIPDDTVDRRYENTIRPEWLEMWADAAGGGKSQDLMPLLKDVKAPVLLLYGKQELIGTKEYALFLCDHIAGSEVFIMDRTRHHPEEERPADYAKVVRTWLAFSDVATGPFPAE